MRPLSLTLRLVIALGLVFALAVVTFAPAPRAVTGAPLVQDDDDPDDDPDDDATVEAAAGGFPARIAAGACDALGADPAFALTNVTPRGEGGAGRIFVSASDVAATLDDLLAAPHAISVIAGGADLVTILACGDLIGSVVDGQLVVPLRAANDDDLAGIAVLDAADGEVHVELYLVLTGDTAVDDDGDDDETFDDDGDGGV